MSRPRAAQAMFSPAGEAALARLVDGRPLLAFDFDGTLAPIVARPDHARIAPAVMARLAKVARQVPLAIISGRAADDVRARLDFEPRFVVGNHGAELGSDLFALRSHGQQLDSARRRLEASAPALTAVGVVVEDKGLSIALHYRTSRRRGEALALLRRLLSSADPSWRTFGGKLVENIVPADAPDKAQALRDLACQCGADTGLFAGDDVTDELAFASAPPDWLTLRVGRGMTPTLARFIVDSPADMPELLDRILRLLDAEAAQRIS